MEYVDFVMFVSCKLRAMRHGDNQNLGAIHSDRT